MSQDLFEINQSNLRKIFESHEIRGLILFTDVLKICTATRIFPNLLTSKDLRKLIIQVTSINAGDELSAKLSFEEMKEFLKQVATHSFPSRRGLFDQYRMLFLHMRNPCYLRYNIILETDERSKKVVDLSKIKASQGVTIRPINEKSMLSLSPYRSKIGEKYSQNIDALVSPKLSTIVLSGKTQEDSSRDSSAQPSPKVIYADKRFESYDFLKSTVNRSKETIAFFPAITDTFHTFNKKTQDIFSKKKIFASKEIKILIQIRQKAKDKFQKLKLGFLIWKYSR